MSNEPKQNLSLALGAKGIAPANVSELNTLAEMMVKGGVFKGTVMECVCAIGMGAEVGLSPFQAVQVIKPINGKFAVFGDGITALLHASGRLESMREWIEGEGDARTAICELKRFGMAEPIVGRFSVADAKRAMLWGKQGPWTQYSDRMLQMRGRGFAARDGFSDVLRGIISAEEAQDYPRPTVANSRPLPGTVPADDHAMHTQERKETLEYLDSRQKAIEAEFAKETAKNLSQGVPEPVVVQPDILAPKVERRPFYPPSSGIPEPIRADMHPAQKLAIRQGLCLPVGVEPLTEGPNAGEPKKTRAEHLHIMGEMLGEIFAGDVSAMADQLERTSGFQGKDGWVKGFNSLKAARLAKVSDKWIETTYHKVKEMWLEFTGRKLVAGEAPEAPVPVPEPAAVAPVAATNEQSAIDIGEEIPF